MFLYVFIGAMFNLQFPGCVPYWCLFTSSVLTLTQLEDSALLILPKVI